LRWHLPIRLGRHISAFARLKRWESHGAPVAVSVIQFPGCSTAVLIIRGMPTGWVYRLWSLFYTAYTLWRPAIYLGNEFSPSTDFTAIYAIFTGQIIDFTNFVWMSI
jgi:hypothetical protein